MRTIYGNVSAFFTGEFFHTAPPLGGHFLCWPGGQANRHRLYPLEVRLGAHRTGSIRRSAGVSERGTEYFTSAGTRGLGQEAVSVVRLESKQLDVS